MIKPFAPVTCDRTGCGKSTLELSSPEVIGKISFHKEMHILLKMYIESMHNRLLEILVQNIPYIGFY